jgi:Transmembrane secretion effector
VFRGIDPVAGMSGVGGKGFRWYLAAQVVSLAGTMMGYTALFWLVLHIQHGGPAALAAVDAAMSLPMLLFSRRAGTIVSRYRAARVMMVTQALLATASLAIGVPSSASSPSSPGCPARAAARPPRPHPQQPRPTGPAGRWPGRASPSQPVRRPCSSAPNPQPPNRQPPNWQPPNPERGRSSDQTLA